MTPHPALAGFHEAVRQWFAASFEAPTRAQALAWPALRQGRSALVVAPTGSGKTLAAFLAAVDRVMFEPVPPRERRCRVLYVSPLRALAVDVERNLRTPVLGVARWAERLGTPVHAPAIALRTGDTPAGERQRLLRAPPDFLITTPESLYLLLTSRARETLRGVRWLILDEVHALLGTKRGAHLALSLERLEALVDRPLQRVGLSATVHPVDEAARFLGGVEGERAPVALVDAGQRKPLALTVEAPVEDLAPPILDLVRAHRSTLIFVNSRRLAERLAASLNELAEDTVVQAHHGSIAREQRLAIEERLKAGALPALVATSSLELGIDMGAIDLVVQVEAPPSVASGLQRVGRAGHRLDAPSSGVILPKYRGDLLACAALTACMRDGRVEAIRYPRNPLDVLAQQIVAMVAMDAWRVDDLERVLRRAAPFAELPRGALERVLDMLSGRYPSDEFAGLRPRVTWDRVHGTLTAREGARSVAITSGGTIPDRGLYGVFLAGAPPGRGRVGELDEELVFESKPGDTFLLGASTWRIEEITHDRVVVSPAPGEPGRMPFWHGDRPGRPLEFGRAVGALTRELRALDERAALERLTTRHALTPGAASTLLAYLRDQAEAAGAVPDDRTILVERSRDDLGDWRVCVLSPFGGQVHGPWAMAIAARVHERTGLGLDVLWTDDGIVARFPDVEEPPEVDLLFPRPDEVEALVIRQLGAGGGARQAALGSPASALFASRFREAAARALLLPRRHPARRVPLWQQRKRAADLLAVAARFDTFPIVLEAYRECLRDVFDIPGLVAVLRQVEARELHVATADTRAPSPFAAALMFTYVANFLYEGDAPMAERRAQALTVDPAQLRELIGAIELRELLDGEALAALERELQHLAPGRLVRHADGLHDLLLRLGDLDDGEIAARCAVPAEAPAWVAALAAARRLVRLPIAGEPRWIAIEDVARYRDALGLPTPAGVPEALLAPVADPLGDLVARHARTHGPFQAVGVARRLGIAPGPVTAALAALAAAGRVVQGEFRPGGRGLEWCEAGVLRLLRQRSLARLRREVEPVEPATLGRLAVHWQGLWTPRRGVHALLDVIAQLQGAALPASVVEADVLRARLADYDPRQLDALMASGAVVWAGAGALGPRDGRLRLALAEHAPFLLASPAEPRSGPLHDKIRAQLATRGALFYPQLLQAIGGFPPDLLEALWDLVWDGEVTNDTLQPVRARIDPPRRRKERPGRGPRADGAVLPLRGARPEAGGRWSLVESLTAGGSTPTERLAARARQLLERHGVLTREAIAAESVEGGFAAVYGVLRSMEEAGRIRRGYFVAGRGAAQFALPGALERLRALRQPGERRESLVLAATDPASPYGAALPWPERDGGRRPMRAAGAFVVLVDGALAAWLAPGERELLTFPEAVLPLPWDDVRADVEAALARAGFLSTPRGYVRRP